MDEQSRARLAFKAFRNLGDEGKKEVLQRWLQKMNKNEIKQTAMLMEMLILKEKMVRRRK